MNKFNSLIKMDTLSFSSKISKISKFDLDEFNPEVSFQNISHFFNKETYSNNLSESVMNLTQCFICLSNVNYPLSCPKCNNFACKKCFDNYFGYINEKNCPICKQMINKKDLKRSRTIKEIENIIYKKDKKTNKVKELSKLIKEKKKMWENQDTYLKDILSELLKYQENLKIYRKEYEIFFSNLKAMFENTLQEYEETINKLINLLLTYNEKYSDDFKTLIIKYKELKKIKEKDEKNEKDDIYNDNIINENIPSLVNEIITLERKHFNEEKKNEDNNNNNSNNKNKYCIEDIIYETTSFLMKPIVIIPNLSTYSIGFITIDKKNIKNGSIKQKGYNVHIGDYQIKYTFGENNFSSLCKFYFKNNNNAEYFITQKKELNKSYKIYTMKLISKKNIFTYEAQIDFNELKEEFSQINMETKVQVFSLIPSSYK